MQSDTIKWGETYDISATAQDADGAPIAIDGTWSAAMRITLTKIGGTIIHEPTLAIAANAASCSIDTGDAPWRDGIYYYDIRFTDPDGHDFWTDPVRLTLKPRNTPNT